LQRLSKVAPPGDLDPCAWIEARRSLDEIRAAVAEAAKKNEWFKREDKGEALGNFITERWDQLAVTDGALPMARAASATCLAVVCSAEPGGHPAHRRDRA
jgi:hypothetical protein